MNQNRKWIRIENESELKMDQNRKNGKQKESKENRLGQKSGKQYFDQLKRKTFIVFITGYYNKVI